LANNELNEGREKCRGGFKEELESYDEVDE